MSMMSHTMQSDQQPTRVEQLLRDAHTLYNRGDFTGCASICEQAYALDNKNQALLLLFGACKFMQRDYDASLHYSQRAIDLNPNFAEAYGNIGNVYKERNDLKTAMEYYSKAANLKPTFADVHGNMGSVYLHQQQHGLALQHYEKAVSLQPMNANWQVDLGHLYRLHGRLADGKRCFERAIEINPRMAVAWSNLACINKDEGLVDLSITHYKKAIEINPQFIDAYANAGNVFKDAGRLAEAQQMYEAALHINPNAAVVIGNLAAVELELGQVEKSLTTFKKALELQPNFPDCLSNMGNALKLLGRLQESIQAYQEALKLRPNHADALNNLANAFKEAGNAVEAESLYRKAIQVRPHFAGAHSNLGNLLKEQHKLDEALREYEAAIAADPRFADAYSNMGNALKDLGRFDDAIKRYEQAIQLRPSFADAYGNLASVYKDTGNLPKAIQYYNTALSMKKTTDPIAYCNLVHCLQTVCDWTNRDDVFKRCGEIISKQMRSGAVPSVQPHHALVYPFDAYQQHEIASHYARASLRNVTVQGLAPYQYDPAEEAAKLQHMGKRRLRVGYVSSDLGNHPLAHLMQHIFVWHDTSKFEVFCYATSRSDGSEWRKLISEGVEHFKEVPHLPHRDLAALIRQDDIDILINLNGYTKGSRNEAFALRPSPVQAMYLGFPGSSGAYYMQYYITDKIASPPELSGLYTEKLAYMPHCYFVNDHAASFASQASELSEEEINENRKKYGLPPRPNVVFCMFNQLYKIDPNTFDAWVEILHRVPNSVLWLLQFPPSGEENIKKQAAEHGLEPGRLVFSGVAPKAEHISRGRLADLFLDTPLCNAHTTGTDILWGGIPVLTRPLESLASRVGASLLSAANLSELIAQDKDAYVKKAVSLGNDLESLRALQRRVAESRFTEALFDTKRWCADWQKLLIAMVRDYREHCAKLAQEGKPELYHLQEAGIGLDGLPLPSGCTPAQCAVTQPHLLMKQQQLHQQQLAKERQQNGDGKDTNNTNSEDADETIIHRRDTTVHALPGPPVTFEQTPFPMFHAPTPVKILEDEWRPPQNSKGYTTQTEVQQLTGSHPTTTKNESSESNQHLRAALSKETKSIGHVSSEINGQ